jgi:hypothetical protein
MVIFRWAQRQGFLREVATAQMPKQSKGTRGRAIKLEEFERVILAVPKAVEETDVEGWEFYLNGLWTSGLRLENQSPCDGTMGQKPS